MRSHKRIGGSLWFAMAILVLVGLLVILPNLGDPAMPVTASVWGGLVLVVAVAAIWTRNQEA